MVSPVKHNIGKREKGKTVLKSDIVPGDISRHTGEDR